MHHPDSQKEKPDEKSIFTLCHHAGWHGLQLEQWVSFTDEAMKDTSAYIDMLVHPLVVGHGQPLFVSLATKAPFACWQAKPTPMVW